MQRGRPMTRAEAAQWIERHSTYVFPWARCQTWKYKKTDKGYGRAKYRGQEWRAHRLAWTLYYGPLPDGLQVQHRCNNPACIRPTHLLLGTNVTNVAYMMACGRHTVRNPHGEAILTEEQSRAIREGARLGESLRRQAAFYGVSLTTIARHRRKA